MTMIFQFKTSEHIFRHPEDIKTMQNTLFDLGFLTSDVLIEDLYEDFSEDRYCAGWLILPENPDELKERMLEFMEWVKQNKSYLFK